MKRNNLKNHLVLAIALSTRGFGFAILEGQDSLVNWGRKQVQGDKNIASLKHVEKLIARNQPGLIVLEDASAKDSRRAARIRKLSQKIIALAASRNIRVALFSRTQVKRAFFAHGKGTKHEIAEVIAAQFPDELALLLPPKRRAWDNEDPRMDIFDAVALALTLRL